MKKLTNEITLVDVKSLTHTFINVKSEDKKQQIVDLISDILYHSDRGCDLLTMLLLFNKELPVRPVINSLVYYPVDRLWLPDSVINNLITNKVIVDSQIPLIVTDHYSIADDRDIQGITLNCESNMMMIPDKRNFCSIDVIYPPDDDPVAIEHKKMIKEICKANNMEI